MNKYSETFKSPLFFMLLCSLLLQAGCQTQTQRDPAFSAVRPSLPPVEPDTDGAIYKPGFELRYFEDIKARRVGDILTVLLDEATTATKASKTDITKSNDSSITNPTIFGTTPEFSLPKFTPLAATQDLDLGTSLASEHTLAGDGSAEQSNLLQGNIPVTVVEVLPNGNLIVRGEKRVTLNNGIEYVQLSGIIRPFDILSNNTIKSSQVADATINYVGEGAIADAQEQGWLARFFSSPFMPY